MLEFQNGVHFYTLSRDWNADDIALLADVLVGLQVDALVFPDRALAGGQGLPFHRQRFMAQLVCPEVHGFNGIHLNMDLRLMQR